MMRYAPLKKEAEKSALPAAGGSVVDIVCTSQHPASLPFLNPQVGQPFQHKLVGFGQDSVVVASFANQTFLDSPGRPNPPSISWLGFGSGYPSLTLPA